jgi:hypothetical protein
MVEPVQPTVKAARIAGSLYLLLIVTSLSAFIYTGALIVSGDANATANNILASETLFRISVIIELASSIVFLFLVRALSRLLGGVNKGYASLMETFVYVSIPISFLSATTQIAAAQLVHGAGFLSVFNQKPIECSRNDLPEPKQPDIICQLDLLRALALPLGILVQRSGFIPKILGILLFINGSAYLVNLFIQFVLPTYANVTFPVLAVLYLVGEPPLAAWLLIKGVKVRSVPKA